MKRFYLSKLFFLAAIIAGAGMSASAQTTTFGYTGGIVTWVVPPGVTSVGILCNGASGGNSSSNVGGHGASMYGAVTVIPGHTLKILVGQTGFNASNAGGGGGGTFVWDNASTTFPLMAAGGGGGAGYCCSSSGPGVDASTGNNGLPGLGGYNGGGIAGSGGTVPTTTAGYTHWAAGGGGWTSAGSNGNGCGATGGASPLSGGAGGNSGGGSVGAGGFGGGGGGDARCGIIGGGGGGGYSGGGPGCDNVSFYQPGGGGGSYNGGTAQVNNILATTGNGSASITILCTAPGTISGNAPLCPGNTETLTETSPGGTWSSSNTAVATVGSTTGVVTAVAPGNAVITYTVSNPCGPLATATVTVNGTPSALTSVVICPGSSTTLTDTAAGGTWSSTNTAIATAGTGGVITGVAAGTTTIKYTLSNGCFTTTLATVNAAPPAFIVTGGGTYCVGGTGMHIGLSGSTSGFGYQLMFGGVPVGTATGTGSSLDFGLYTTTGTYTVLATNPTTTCTSTMTGSVTITTNPLPSPITGVANVCVGGTTTLADATPGGTWSSSDPSKATVGVTSGIVTGVFNGSAFISYTSTSTGCSSRISLLVNPNPPGIIGATSVCVGATTSLSELGSGTWTSSNLALAFVGSSSGIVTGISSGIPTITFTYPTGCYTTTPIVVNSLPDSTNMVTGGGSYCAGGTGMHVGLTYSNSGINYQLLLAGSPLGAALPGSNSGLDFGAQTSTGTYTVQGTNAITGCSVNMAGSATISIASLSPSHSMTGGGSYCAGGAGVSIGLDGSSPGTSYQLYNGASPVGLPVSGTGSPFNFGVFAATGTYTVIGTDSASGCTQPMTGAETVTSNPLPIAYALSSGGSYCAGGTGIDIALSNSEIGDMYKLMLGTSAVDSVISSGGAIDFGHFTAPGLYTIVAYDAVSSCPNNMLGSATIVVNPAPTVYNVTGGGGYCAGGSGAHVGLSFSNSGIKYQLWQGVVAIGLPVSGTGLPLDFGPMAAAGVYTVTATNPATGCGSNMAGSATVNINLPPITYNVTGGGNLCIGGTGVAIGTNGSELGVSYQLFRGTTPIGSSMTGTGPGITFGTFTVPGVYTAVATNSSTGCTTTLLGSATVVVSALPTAYMTMGGGSFCADDTGVHVKLFSSDPGVNYELYYNGSTTGIILSGTGSMLDFGLVTSGGTYTIVATNTTSLCSKNMSGSATVIVNPLPNPFDVIGGGGVCPGGPGVHVGLDGSSTGYTYQMYNGGLVGTPLAGSGSAIDFGAQTVTGSYAIIGKNLVTGCSGLMNGSATISANPTPTNYTVSGGGPACAFGTGLPINLSGSDIGTNYQVYKSGAIYGTLMPGSGAPMLLGTFTGSGSYTIVATNGAGCTATMSGSAVINIISPAVYAVTGGGNYCAGGTGVVIGLAGSAATETYQLMQGTSTIGAPISGTGSSLNFGPQTTAGTYTVVASNILYGCTDTMAGIATIGINPLPTVNNVTGTGSYCAGGAGLHVMLSGSNTGVHYQLYNGWVISGSAMSGTGVSIDFGAVTTGGNYTVIATNYATGCMDTMSGSAVITVMPQPSPYLITVENDGNYCAADSGLHIGIANSDTGINYRLYRSGTAIGSVKAGTGLSLDMGLQNIAGTYVIVGTNASSGCTANMLGSATINIIPLPAEHNVTGGGSYCAGGDGVNIGLDGSDPGIYYELFDGPYSAGGLMGTGAPLDFGKQIALGNYIIVGNSVITACPNNMLGSANVAYTTLPTPVVVVQAYPGTGIGVWHIDSLKAFVTNGGPSPTYQWLINGAIVSGATNESFTNHQFYNNDSVTCLVTGSGPCGGHTTAQSLILSLYNVGVPVVTTGSGDVKLIPNPNKGVFRVKGTLGITTDEEVSIEVVNMLGQVVYTKKVTALNGVIDEPVALQPGAANGMYILNLRSGAHNSVFHFVVEQ